MNWEMFAFWPICIASTLYIFVKVVKSVIQLFRYYKSGDKEIVDPCSCDGCDDKNSACSKKKEN